MDYAEKYDFQDSDKKGKLKREGRGERYCELHFSKVEIGEEAHQ
jgi:hypothetical protein